MSAQNNAVPHDVAELNLRVVTVLNSRATADGGRIKILTNGLVLTLDLPPGELVAMGYHSNKALGQHHGVVPMDGDIQLTPVPEPEPVNGKSK